jgi:hypothetical protein
MRNHHHPRSTPATSPPPTTHLCTPCTLQCMREKSNAPVKQFWLPPSLPLVGRLQMPSLNGCSRGCLNAQRGQSSRSTAKAALGQAQGRVPTTHPHTPPTCRLKLRGLSKRTIVLVIESQVKYQVKSALQTHSSDSLIQKKRWLRCSRPHKHARARLQVRRCPPLVTTHRRRHREEEKEGGNMERPNPRSEWTPTRVMQPHVPPLDELAKGASV